MAVTGPHWHSGRRLVPGRSSAVPGLGSARGSGRTTGAFKGNSALWDGK